MFFFFFQAEDGIRDLTVTGVQTCALPILAKVCFKYDPNSLVHGVFLEKIAGRLRHPRAVSAFIEATGVGRADSGGGKFDRAVPKPLKGLDAQTRYGHVPLPRPEFTGPAVTADLSPDPAPNR